MIKDPVTSQDLLATGGILVQVFQEANAKTGLEAQIHWK